jgi:hypothetical protein
MVAKRLLDLSTFDGRLLDGLNFCKKVYDMFDQVRGSADGIAKIRMRPTKNEKRLMEELIPIAQYVQARYRADRRIKVRWHSGSQSFDAVLLSSGAFVEHGHVRREVFLEVTRAVHQNEHLVRELINQGGTSFGVKGISRDKKTGKIASEPYVRDGDEQVADLADQVIERLKSKAAKKYAANAILIIECVPNGIVLDGEWTASINRVKDAKVQHNFAEVFVFCGYLSHSATLYGE